MGAAAEADSLVGRQPVFLPPEFPQGSPSGAAVAADGLMATTSLADMAVGIPCHNVNWIFLIFCEETKELQTYIG